MTKPESIGTTMMQSENKKRGVIGSQVTPTNQKFSLHKHSFLFHLRPRISKDPYTTFKLTWYLGYFAMFFFILECVTGLYLMLYYIPTPEKAYGSMVHIMSVVPFGWLMRDLHRLGGECMIIFVVLHMAKTYLSTPLEGAARFTWVTGVVLLLCTLVLAFSGYLLPWDQLAYWAVTIGTGMIDSVPFIGASIASIVRGGAEFSQDGLLRFYLLHVLVVPLICALITGVHYYRVVRVHGGGRTMKPVPKTTVHFFPEGWLFEIVLAILTLSLMILAALFWYDAPLGPHADPLHTPSQTRAPWFFLWLQGALKFGDSLYTGVLFPLVLLLALVALPYVRSMGNGSWLRMSMVFVTAVGLLMLSITGMPSYGIDGSPERFYIDKLIPEEEPSAFHQIGYEDLTPGVYETGTQNAKGMSEPLRRFFAEFDTALSDFQNNVTGILVIEEWQEHLKRVRVILRWPKAHQPEQFSTLSSTVFIYQVEESQ